MNVLKKLKLAFLALVLISTYSCNDNDSESNSGPATISINLVDAPGDYEAVNIEILDVMIKMNDDSDDDSGWQPLNVDENNAGVHNILEFVGGESLLLVNEAEIPAGELSQIRLVLGENNTVVISGEEGEPSVVHDLKTPSGQQSGLKVKVNEELLPGFTYGFTLDFDVDKSIVMAGNSDNIILKPVLRASAVATSGIISGTVSPTDFQSMASVEVDGETISAYTNQDGYFELHGVPVGTYNVTITPDESSGYAVAVVEGVEVVNGVKTDVGEVALQLLPGSITGTITNGGVAVNVSVEVDGETVSVDTDEAGVFLLENIPVGTYTLTLIPAAESGLATKEIESVEVITNAVTDLGEITLE